MAASPTSPTSKPFPPTTLASPEDQRALRQFQKLDELTHLSAALTGPSRSTRIELISNDQWHQLHETRNRELTTVKRTLKQKNPSDWTKQEFVGAVSGKVNQFVIDFLNLFLKDDDATSFIELDRDLTAISTGLPIRKTVAGDRGPTFIAEGLGMCAEPWNPFVLKWSDPFEVAGNELYQAVDDILKEETPPLDFFAVPGNSSFDLMRGRIFSPKEMRNMGAEGSRQFQEVFSHIHDHFHLQPKLPATDKQTVMRLEKINGQNLPDYVRDHYKNLNAGEKASLFRRLGKLALLDLLFGHNDRLITLDPTLEDDQNLPANLGNIMVSHPPDRGFVLYVIDNGVNTELCEIKGQELYLELLKRILSSPQFCDTLSNHVADAMNNCLMEMKGTQVFLEELKTIGERHLAEGIAKMDEIIGNTLGPRWFGDTATVLRTRERLAQMMPGFSETIDQRVRTYMTSRDNRGLERSSRTSITEDRMCSPERFGTPESLSHLIRALSQHCNGTPEDEQFFKTIVLPMRHDSDQIQEVFDKVFEIRKLGLSPERLSDLQRSIGKCQRTLFPESKEMQPVSSTAQLPLCPTPVDPSPTRLSSLSRVTSLPRFGQRQPSLSLSFLGEPDARGETPILPSPIKPATTVDKGS